MVYMSDGNFICRLVITVLIGALLGATLFTFILAEDCKDNKYTNFAGGFYCSNDYGDIVFPKKDINHDY